MRFPNYDVRKVGGALAGAVLLALVLAEVVNAQERPRTPGGGVNAATLATTSNALYTSSERVFNVLDYGADPSDAGIGQDHYALQAAIDAANASTGNGRKVVLMPEGTYYLGQWTYHTNFTSEDHPNMIDLTLTTNLTLRGAGNGKTVVKIFPTEAELVTMNMFGAGDTISSVSNRFGAVNLTFEDFTIDGSMAWGIATNQNFSYDATQFYEMTGATIFRRMGFQNILEDAIDCKGMVISDTCTFTNIGNQTLASGEPHVSRDCVIYNSGIGPVESGYTMVDVVHPGVSIIENATFYGGSGQVRNSGTLTLINCTFTFTNAAPTLYDGYIYTSGNGVTRIRDCTFARPSGSTWVTAASGGTVSIEGSTFGVGSKVISSTNATRVSLIGNYALSQRADNIRIAGGTEVVIERNKIDGPSGVGIGIYGTARTDGLRVVGNKFAAGHLQFDSTAAATNGLIAENIFDGDSSIRNFSANVGDFTYRNNTWIGSGASGLLQLGSSLPAHVRDNVNVAFDFPGFNAQSGIVFEGNAVRSTPVTGDYAYNATNCIWVGNYYMTNRAAIFNPAGPRAFTASGTLNRYVFDSTWNGTDLTATLLSAVEVGVGWTTRIKNLHSTDLTIATTSSQTIDGAAPTALAQYEARSYRSDGANWQIVADYNPNVGSEGGAFIDEVDGVGTNTVFKTSDNVTVYEVASGRNYDANGLLSSDSHNREVTDTSGAHPYNWETRTFTGVHTFSDGISTPSSAVDAVYSASIYFATNNSDGTDLVDFSGPSMVTTNLGNNLTFSGVTGFSATGGTNYYEKVYFIRATGANRTIAAPTEWVTTRANHVATNGVLAKIMVEMQVGIFTNMSQVDFPN